MRSRDRAALALAPLFLRFALALTFIWAGLGKLMATDMVSGEEAAILANYGVLPNPHAPKAPARQEQPTPELKTPSDQPADQKPGEPKKDNGPISAEPRDTSIGAVHLVSSQGADPGMATAADFPEPVPVRRYTGLVLALHHAIHPGLSPKDSSPLMPLWPDFDPKTEYDPWPVRLAWAVSLTELVGGILVGVGLLTRLGAMGLAGVMLGALWLTTFGPALQSGDTLLGFLPKHDPFAPDWMVPVLQVTLLCASLALLFAGPGTLSLDRLLLGGPPKPQPPKPAPAPPAQGKK